MNNVLNLIRDVKPLKNISDDVYFFKQIYETFTLIEWIEKDYVFTIGNFIAQNRPDLVTIGIRLNVQINLFLRTIYNYSSYHDVMFKKIKHSLGCFALTENEAGVLSGLIVDCKFIKKNNDYIICSENVYKQWISQGLVSEYMLIFASNIDDSKDVRIFLCESSNDNIIRNIMDLQPFTKTLDLCKIKFNKLFIPETNVLELTITQTKMEILNGILYGRFMITEAIIHSIMGLVLYLKKTINGIEKFTNMSYDDYLYNLETNLQEYIRHLQWIRNDLLDDRNIFLINCYKAFVVDKCIELFNDITLKFGVRALKYGLKYDTLLLNKVAEGDTSVLRLSIIYTHIKKGYCNMLLNDGFTLYDLFYVATSSKTDSSKYLFNNYKQISDKIIRNHIFTGPF